MWWRDTVDLRHKGFNVKSARVSRAVPESAIRGLNPSSGAHVGRALDTRVLIARVIAGTFMNCGAHGSQELDQPHADRAERAVH